MEDYELTLFDRLNAIRDTINNYVEGSFYIAFSGGKDSTILHYLVDMAIHTNSIPRVFVNTGIEYNLIYEFVKEFANQDERFRIIPPSTPLKQIFEKYGYPFKSKEHSSKLHEYQKGNTPNSVLKYCRGDSKFSCPKCLRYHFTPEFTIKVSQYCCIELKKKPFHKWENENNKPIGITGMRKEEGGQRRNLSCILVDKKGNVKRFHPLSVVSEEWENEFIKRNNIQLCKLYYPPYNFERTGCCGCPYNLKLQSQLDIMTKLLPYEKAKCEVLWKPVYDEYRRIGYRLKENKDV